MEQSHEAILGEVLDRIEQYNETTQTGSPLLALQNAIADALESLPPLKTDDFDQVMDNPDFLNRLIAEAPEHIGWNADKIIEWIEEIANKS